MSWDAWLEDDRGHVEGEWNYTHNTNPMVDEAMARAGRQGSWIDVLDGMTGPEGARLLDAIVRELLADPQTFEAMNPRNGWGAYRSDSGCDRTGIVEQLMKMRDSVPEWPTVWHVSG
jgi:hypothetical protein